MYSWNIVVRFIADNTDNYVVLVHLLLFFMMFCLVTVDIKVLNTITTNSFSQGVALYYSPSNESHTTPNYCSGLRVFRSKSALGPTMTDTCNGY